ncbi:hypothetical protein ACH4TV_36915 [Streptomyces sp. NPDC020898]|uniref:hypothetical protein n=1 Tax=Streptomyces sp. NPDC020898 TaxID=3365101 RepID=UPI0037B1ECC5
MTENPQSPQVDENPDVTPAPVLPKKRLRPRRVATVIGSVLLAGVVVAGVGHTVVTVAGADREAGAPVFKFPQAAAGGDEVKAASASGLAGVLVPYGESGWYRGPDLGEFGYDTQLSGAQATALRKESLSGLPRSQRRQLEKQIDRQRIKGMAMRSYLSKEASSLSDNEGAYSVSVVLARMGSSAAVRDLGTFQQEFLDTLDVFRAGPAIEGHKNAKCFLPPNDDEIEGSEAGEDTGPGLETMYCSAYQGDVLVTATADGPAPLDTKGVAMLLSEQLDRITEPGMAV